VDANLLHVRHDEERWIAECIGVLLQLRVGFDQIAVRALVFPDEAAILPDIGEALAVADFAGRFLEIEIRGARLIDAEQVAQIEKMLLGGGALAAGVAAPLLDELLRRHLPTMPSQN
jgi:hypothetical protein